MGAGPDGFEGQPDRPAIRDGQGVAPVLAGLLADHAGVRCQSILQKRG